MDAAELIAIIEPVVRRLLGEPNRKLSTKTELRFGARGSLSVDLEKGTFFDHEIGQGGGVLDLIGRETGLAGEARFQWILDERLLPNGGGRRPQAGAGRGRIVQAYQFRTRPDSCCSRWCASSSRISASAGRMPTEATAGIGRPAACARFPTACPS